MTSLLPQFILFGASMTEWSFDEATEGFGWFLETMYRDRVSIVNEGEQSPSRRCTTPASSARLCSCRSACRCHESIVRAFLSFNEQACAIDEQ